MQLEENNRKCKETRRKIKADINEIQKKIINLKSWFFEINTTK